MPEKNPIEKLLEEMSRLFETIQDNKDRFIKSEDEIPPQVVKDLEIAEKLVEDFKNFHEEVIKEQGMTKENIKAFEENAAENLPKKEARLFERSQKMKKEFQSLEKEIARSRTLVLLGKTKGKKKGESFGDSRKKKFRKMGIKKDWKPL